MEICNLAELFSSVSQGYRYDCWQSKLYVKPFALKAFLKTYITRGFTSLRIVCHGMRDQKYDAIANDIFGPNLAFSSPSNRFSGNGNLPGFYVGLCDAPAAHYGQGRTGSNAGPLGTMMLALHMQDPPHGKNMLYEDYNLGVFGNSSTYPKYHCSAFGCDARVVKDSTTLLPLGLAFAK